MKLVSWNVNGIRACVKKGFLSWLQGDQSDIICLQETKARVDQLSSDILEPNGYSSQWFSAEKAGYSGVAIYVKKKLKKDLTWFSGIGTKKFDCEGRVIGLEHPKFILLNAYFPNGQRDHGRVPYKMEFCKKVHSFMNKLQKETKKEIIICGDFNTAHHPIDLANPKTNKDTTGFLPIEREWMDHFQKKGYSDLFRYKHGEKPDEYTWWTYRNNCRGRNIGWRIDYFWATGGLLPKVKNCYHMPDVMGSDHCPVKLELKR